MTDATALPGGSEAEEASLQPENAATPAAAGAAASHHDLEHRYYQYLRNQNYSSTNALLQVLRWYLPYFEGFHRVLDIGCGHGEFLQLLQDAGHEAVGVDIDPAMVATCRARGLTAYEGDAIAWLNSQEEPFDAIFSSNVIEHLAAPTVQSLIQHAHAALRPGGMLLIGTPNPESLIVQFHEFWRDPTHVRLYSRQLIEFFFADAGFTQIQNSNNAEAIWNGIDLMLKSESAAGGADQGLPPIEPLPPATQDVSPLHPLPQPPASGAPLRQRIAFRLLNVVYRKFLEPYLALIRLDQERQHQQLRALQAHVIRLHESNVVLHGALQTRTAQLEGALRFLFPSREHFVYGYKAQTEKGQEAAEEATATAAD